jgi:endogenous inhibitor of DNA gyrase (YacG/DUF329 family)
VNVQATCPTCGKAVQLDLDVDGLDAALAEGLRKLASHTLCSACAGPERRKTKPHRPAPPSREARLPYVD